MQSSSVERHIDRRNGAPNQRPRGRRPKDKTNRPKPTPTDLAHAKQKRKENRDTYALALAAAQQSVWDQAEALRDQFGKHDTNFYFEEIIHRSHLKVAERSVSRWNAFLSLELARRNKELPSGVPLLKATDVNTEISAKWKSMSLDEQITATEDTVAALKERREAKAFAPHQVPIHAFHDMRANVESIEKELVALHARTGTEMLLIAVRSSSDRFNQPYYFNTSEKVSDFFTLTFKFSLPDIVSKLECFCLSGVEGVLAKRDTAFLELKKKTASLITGKLQKITGTKGRMFYTNFDDNITDKHGIIVKNWPLSVFCAPGDIRTLTELKVLCNAWESGTAHFYRMNMDEATKWVNERSNRAIAETSGPAAAPPTTVTAPSPNQDLPSQSGSGDSAVNGSEEQANPAQTINTPAATTTSEQANPTDLASVASTPVFDPSLTTPDLNSTSPSTSATASSAKRARATDGEPSTTEGEPSTNRRRQDLNPAFINTFITSVNGATVLMNKKPRKERSDKGRKRTK